MSNVVSPNPASAFDRRIVTLIFVGLMVFNLWGVSVGWKNLNLPGCEFRQAQTALSALFIQRDHDFSLAYPTPVLGAPWSVPMEFPLYQWTVVIVSDTTGISLTSAARTVSAVCFYLALPAFYLLLRRLGLSPTQRLIGLGFIVSCPLYIFYTRAFLIETMALMFGAWYLAALIATIERRRWSWLALCVLASTGVGLVKVTTFILFLIPAFVCSLLWLWQSRPAVAPPRSWRPLLQTLGWLALAHAIPFAATKAWVVFSDNVKMLNPSGEALTSFNLAGWNFGIGQRFSPVVWAAHWRIFFHDLISPVTVALCFAAAFFISRRWLLLSLASLGLFLAVQLVFPVLYAWHDYYYVANAFALMLAAGAIAAGVVAAPHVPRAAAYAGIVVAYGCQILLWYNSHLPQQRFAGMGGNSLNVLVKAVTDPDETLVVAGDDWNSMLPYYSQRRALMLRDDIIRSPAKLDAALENMKGTPVTMLILRDDWKGNQTLIQKAAKQLGIDERMALTWEGGQIYLHRGIRTEVLAGLEAKGLNRFPGFSLPPEAAQRDKPLANVVVQYASLPARHKKIFRHVSPAPESFFSTVGPELWNEAGEERLFAHPETKLWFALDAGNYRVRTSIAMTESSYTGVAKSDATDGVSLIFSVITATGERHEVFHRDINPRDNPADRGVQPIDAAVTMPSGGKLEIAVTPGPANSSARDWTTLGALRIEPEKLSR